MKQERTLQKANTPALNNYDKTNIDIIKYYLSVSGEGFELTEIQLRILERLRYADEIIRESNGSKKREELVTLIVNKFMVNRVTAMKDIVHAEDVFSSSYPLNKMYEIGLRISFLKEQVRLAAHSNDYKAVAMLEKVLQEYYSTYPDFKPERTKKTLIFQFQQANFNLDGNAGIATHEPMSLEQALQIADQITEDE